MSRTPYLVRYPVPLREDFYAELVLPDDLTTEEAEKVARFVKSLGVEEGALRRDN